MLIYSGGLDSTVLLYKLLADGYQVQCLSINYGQRHLRELELAKILTANLNIEHRVVDLSSLQHLLAGSSQTSADIPVPQGHYAEANMAITVVPGRNLIMLALASAWAQSSGCENVAYAAHAGDHHVYPDCRPDFVEAAAEAMLRGYGIVLLRPFLHHSKADIVRIGADLDVPFVQTYSCYCGRALHCGLCGTCGERRLAFIAAQVQDPTAYEVPLEATRRVCGAIR